MSKVYKRGDLLRMKDGSVVVVLQRFNSLDKEEKIYSVYSYMDAENGRIKSLFDVSSFDIDQDEMMDLLYNGQRKMQFGRSISTELADFIARVNRR